MAGELTLGEVQAEALTRAEPVDLAEQVVGVEAFVRGQEELATDVMVTAAYALAGEVGPLLGLSADEVYTSLGSIPDNMLELLKSPQGWTALAAYVAGDLSRPLPVYKPTVN